MVNYWVKQPDWKTFWYTLQPTKRMKMRQKLRHWWLGTRLCYELKNTIRPKLIAWAIVPNAEGHMCGYHSDVEVDCWVL